MGEKLKYTSYLAGYIEAATGSCAHWRNEVKDRLKDAPIIFYDPVEREAQKTGKKSGEHVNYIKGLKQGGHWEKFREEMTKIWFGGIKPEGHIPDVFTYLRTRKLIDGNELRDLDFWADYEATIRSDFVIANMPSAIKTIGTVGEIFVAYMYRIPIYLILDQSKTDCNSTLLYWVLESGGDVFYSPKECCDYVKTKYSIK
jgi:hypothetical protein